MQHGLSSGYARGNLLTTSTVDYYSWSGTAGDTVYLASETPGNPSQSGLYYEIDRGDGGALTSFYANYNNQGQSTPITLPYTGTYYVHVGSDYSYTGEYRFRLTEAPPTVQLVTKYGTSVTNANTPTLVNSAPGHLTASAVAGYIGQGDPGGDFFSLGNVQAGTTLNLTLTKPGTSSLGGVLNIYNAAGVNLTNNTAAGATLTYTVPAGQGGAYYARVSSASQTTVSFWMNWNGIENEVPISFSSNYPMSLWLDNGSFGFNYTGSGDLYGISSAGLANTWHLVTATFTDGSASQDQLWIDGVKQTLTPAFGQRGAGALLGTSASIGSFANGGYAFTGTLDEVAFFNRTLSTAEIQAEFTARNSGSYSTLIVGQAPSAYYRLGETSGQISHDSSGKAYDGTFGTGITLGAAGALGGDSSTAYQFTNGLVSVVVPQSTGILGQYVLGDRRGQHHAAASDRQHATEPGHHLERRNRPLHIELFRRHERRHGQRHRQLRPARGRPRRQVRHERRHRLSCLQPNLHQRTGGNLSRLRRPAPAGQLSA